MAVDIFLKLGDVDGESKDEKHKKWIDVLAWSWGLSQAGSFQYGGGGGSGKANFQDLSITKYIDMSSPPIMMNGASGKHFPDAELVVRKAGGKKPLDYLVVKLTDVIITSYSTGGSGGEDRLTETISLGFAKVKLKYTEQTEAGGEGAKPEFAWDIQANVAL
ncbi:type VI secretion system effector, Hcp1 family [Hartmannibacter diazotrophicus]|uniref:Type VI secretion system effector, Hcp1 family n=1 Tax=Hartmannibacter diazotrophicus TaxID=1482074 RepID=A0A2C9D6S6_9HYPH|nr:type VI secretion system tube protein Hcp [Hartmannibacter diazotrophicus]SON55879.1 type VI secretion system effector, Hcp1 family [Hartmannibacter diazotrophicus]